MCVQTQEAAKKVQKTSWSTLFAAPLALKEPVTCLAQRLSALNVVMERQLQVWRQNLLTCSFSSLKATWHPLLLLSQVS